ncbi:MAG: ABC transporter permease [Azospirillaceae bacterium]|nr:ABC transporter permease [Azospirillaceae bacterium]
MMALAVGASLRRRAAAAGWPLLAIALFLAAWEAVTRTGLFPPTILVPLEQVWQAFLDLSATGELQDNLWASASRVMTGFVLGGSTGLVVGVALGLSPRLERYIGLPLDIVRQVPFIAWGPMLILLLGIGEPFKIAIIANAAFFPVALNACDGVRNVSGAYRDVAALYQFSTWRTLRRIVLPASMPAILTGLRLALSRSWMMVVAAELFGADSGIGHMMNWAREMFQLDVVMVGIVLTGLIGFALDQVLRGIERRLSPWRQPAGA